jgi:hypothetical protein
MSLLAFEQIVILVFGLALGTWAGFQMSRMVVSALAVTDQGNAVVPPFTLLTDWTLMVPTYAVLLVFFVGVIFILNRSVARINLFAITRGGEE